MVTANNRIFYACQMIGLRKMDPLGLSGSSSALIIAHGVQSVGMTTNFNLEQAFELGQIQIYENIEGVPDVEVTMEKVLDGYPLLYHLASPAPQSVGLVGRGKDRMDLSLGIYSDAFDSVTDSGNVDFRPQVEVFCSGMYVGSISYTVPVDGNATESVTFQGNQKQWTSDTGNMLLNSSGLDFGTASGFSLTTSPDEPKALTDISGGVQRRENVKVSASSWPNSIAGVAGGSASANVHMQSFTCSTDYSREDIMELGTKVPYFRSPGFPIEVSCEIEAIAVTGDFVSAYEKGDPELVGKRGEGDNTTEETIIVKLQDGTCFNLGAKNRLSSVSYAGGDTGGGNVSCTYSYTNFNELEVLHPQDPAIGLYTGEQRELCGLSASP
jgi:hypothetical protein